MVDTEGAPLVRPWRSIPYAGWLVVEIIKSNLGVMLRILRPDRPITPCPS